MSALSPEQSLSMQIREKARGLTDAPFFQHVADQVLLLQERLSKAEAEIERLEERIADMSYECLEWRS